MQVRGQEKKKTLKDILSHLDNMAYKSPFGVQQKTKTTGYVSPFSKKVVSTKAEPIKDRALEAKGLIDGMVESGQAVTSTPIIAPRKKEEVKQGLLANYPQALKETLTGFGKGLFNLPKKYYKEAVTPALELWGKGIEKVEKGFEPSGDQLFSELDTKDKAKAFGKEYAAKIVQQPQTFVEGALGAVSNSLGYLERFGWDKAKPHREKMEEWEDVLRAEDPDATTPFVSGVGSMATYYLAGKVIGVTSFFAGLSPKVANIFGNSVFTLLESSSEAGGVYQELIDRGIDKKEASRQADLDFGINVLLLGLTNKFDFTKQGQLSIFKQIKNRLLTGGREAIQELGQQVAGNVTTYKQWDEGVKDAFKVGGTLGFMFGGSANPNVNINVETQEEIKSLLEQAIKSEAGFAKVPSIADVFGEKPKDLSEKVDFTRDNATESLQKFTKHPNALPSEKKIADDFIKQIEKGTEDIDLITDFLQEKTDFTLKSETPKLSWKPKPLTRKEQLAKREAKITPKKVKEFVGETPTPFIRKREMTLLKERIKNIQKSAKSEFNKKAEITKLKKQFEEKLKTSLRKEELKTLSVGITQRIKGIARGIREGKTLTKKEIEKNQTEIIDILDESKLEREDKAKFIRAIKNIQTKEQLEKTLPEIQERIEKLEEKAEGKRYIKNIQKEIKKTIVKGAKPKGKYTPEIQNTLNSIKKLTDLNQKQAEAKIEQNLKEYAVKMPDNIVMENYILSLYTGTSIEKKELLSIVKQLIEKGEMASALKKFNTQADIQAKSDLVVDRVTGGEGIEQGRLLGEPAYKTKIQAVKQYLKAIGKKTILDWRGLMTTLDFNSSVKDKPLADFFSVSKNESKYKELQSKYKEDFDIAFSDIYEIKNKPNKILREINKIATDKVRVDKYEFTRDELIKRYMEIQDQTLIDSFIEGNKYTEKTLKEITNKISSKDKKFAEWQLKYYREIYDKVNEVYRVMNGVDLPFNEFYSPIKRVGYKVEPGHTEFLDEVFYRKAVTNKSLTSRVKNLNPIAKQGSMSVLDRHITDINYYIAWAEKIRELDSVFNNNQVREAINQEFPSNILETINNKIQHIATHGNKTASRIGWVDYVRKNYVIGNLAVKPALTIKQLVSILAYTEKISAKSLVAGILDFSKNPVKNYKTLQNESAFIKTRGSGMERDIQDALKEGVFSRYNKKQNLANNLLLNIKLGDKGAIVLGSWSLRKQRLKEGKTLDEAISEYEEFSADTQQSADISRLSEIQLGGSIEKLFTVFKSSQRAYLQKELNAVKSMFRKDGFGKDNIKKVAKTLWIYHVLLPITFQFISNMGGWDEEDRKDYLRAGLLGSFNGLFIAGDIIDGIIRQVMGMKVWDTEVIIADVGDDFVKIIRNLTEDDVSTEDLQTALDAMASAGTGLSGLPIEYNYDILESLYNGNYETGLKQILGWSEYTIGGEKKSKSSTKGAKSIESVFGGGGGTTKTKSISDVFK